ncbi:MAG: hypothetical protein IJ677_01805 [Alphaproteobacteria bacterium]|nr:hypothetical protein [Alphaproteobacteria bacterium]
MWVICGLITSLVGAIYYICNQESKLTTKVFMVYRGLLVAIMTTPLALACFYIFPWQFYAIAVFQGISISYLDYKYFNAFHKFGAENVNSTSPLSVFIIFILWLILKPNTIGIYLETPMQSLVIIVSLILMVFSVIKYSQQKIGKSCLKEIFPLLCFSAVVDISNKFITDYSEGHLLILTFHRVAITGWIIGIINLFYNRGVSCRELINIKNIRQSWFISLIVVSMVLINISMYYAPNPAYISAMLFLSVIWIVIINRIMILCGRNIPFVNIKLKWILLLLTSAVVMVIATQQ